MIINYAGPLLYIFSPLPARLRKNPRERIYKNKKGGRVRKIEKCRERRERLGGRRCTTSIAIREEESSARNETTRILSKAIFLPRFQFCPNNKFSHHSFQVRSNYTFGHCQFFFLFHLFNRKIMSASRIQPFLNRKILEYDYQYSI